MTLVGDTAQSATGFASVWGAGSIARRACDKTAQGCRESGYPGFQMPNNASNPNGVSEGWLSGLHHATQPFQNPVGVSIHAPVRVPRVAADTATLGYPMKALRANADWNWNWREGINIGYKTFDRLTKFLAVHPDPSFKGRQSRMSPHPRPLSRRERGVGVGVTTTVSDEPRVRDAGRKIALDALAATMARRPGGRKLFLCRNVTPCQTRRLCPPDAPRRPAFVA